uniref:Dynein regulatory complex protein 9 n=1 Tax=Rhizochromulina marina TaxID=1034831 RepID=A0A7S2WP24_9STRA|mmetsp:Transcript_2903/g.8270  ORF Transcript_2903/g.8270 Transcript_2903/m.8270 type:complete len:182 (+) Transcript_2903:1-546(+)
METKLKTNVDARYFKKEAHAMTSAVLRSYQQSERSQESRIKDMETKLETENVVHKETVDFLLRKQRQLQEDIDSWTSKYDRDYGDLESRYKVLKDKQMRNRERLEHLQARKKAEDERDREERELQERQAELERLQKLEEQQQAYAASQIQRVVRAFLKRRAEQAASKGKKKKKGGGKKKKK